MFASASHEFRTPLNAIINSYEFLKSTYRNAIELINAETSLNVDAERKLDRYNNTMEKFLNIGANSSNLL